MKFGDLLEVGNGIWAILALWLTVFLIYHLAVVRAQRRLAWRRFIIGLPFSMQIAVGTFVVSLAILLTRSIIWWARYRHDGNLDLLVPETQFYFAGVALGAVGFLCILRSVSQPAFGKWPWVGAICNVTAYLIWWGSKFF